MKADQANTRTVDVHDRVGNVVGSKDVVLYAGLLNQAHEEGLARVRTSILQIPTEETADSPSSRRRRTRRRAYSKPSVTPVPRTPTTSSPRT